MRWQRYHYRAPFKLFKYEVRNWMNDEVVDDGLGNDMLISRKRGIKTLQIFWWTWDWKIKYEGEI